MILERIKIYLQWANGDSSCGYWQDDEYHGKGILNKDDVIKEGNWIKGELKDK